MFLMFSVSILTSEHFQQGDSKGAARGRYGLPLDVPCELVIITNFLPFFHKLHELRRIFAAMKR
jgi:hypothetical protein